MNWIAALVLCAVLALASPAFAAPQLSGLGSVFKKKDKNQQQQQQQPSSDQQQQGQQQQGQQQDDKNKDKKPEDKKMLFSDDSASSKQKKDTTAMGFSGLNPDGTVENAVLNSSPTADDEAKAAALSQVNANPTEVKQFITDGQLKSKGGN
jgi:transcription initiation factor TFIID subunit TAF12